MDFLTELSKKLPVKYIPITVKVCTAEFFGKSLEVFHIVGLSLKKHLVVPYLCRDKGKLLTTLTLLKVAVNPKTLHPSVPKTSRVGGCKEIWYDTPAGSTQTTHQDFPLFLFPMRQLFNTNEVILKPLIVEHILQVAAV